MGCALLQEIGTVCARALERQTRHTQLQQRSIATVLLDEGGLPGVSSDTNKCHAKSYGVMQSHVCRTDLA